MSDLMQHLLQILTKQANGRFVLILFVLTQLIGRNQPYNRAVSKLISNPNLLYNFFWHNHRPSLKSALRPPPSAQAESANFPPILRKKGRL